MVLGRMRCLRSGALDDRMTMKMMKMMTRMRDEGDWSGWSSFVVEVIGRLEGVRVGRWVTRV
jgi:hypothetical protein